MISEIDTLHGISEPYIRDMAVEDYAARSPKTKRSNLLCKLSNFT